MAEPTATEDLDQRIRDSQDKFNVGQGADGDASPYPLLRELRAQSPVHEGWPELGMMGNSGGGPPTFTAYTFDAVKAVFTDNVTYSTRCYEDVVRPLQGPTILELQDPEHAIYRKLHEFVARALVRITAAGIAIDAPERLAQIIEIARRS